MGVARNAAFSIHSTPFRADLYVMPLASFDMVLGTQWLATLGPIVWDFSTRTAPSSSRAASYAGVDWQG